MASNGDYQQQQQFKCDDCSLPLNSAESLEVHRQYHQENLMQQWAAKSSVENKERVLIKREFPSNAGALQQEGLEMHKTSPDYQRTTPEAVYGHPPTPQSYHSSSSPYQNADSSMFPIFPSFTSIKRENRSPSQSQLYQQHFATFADQSYGGMEAPYNPEEANGRPFPDSGHLNNFYQYQKYYEHSKQGGMQQGYPPQPTPSPSPKQCEKCRFVCETASELIEHMTIVHPRNHFSSTNQLLFDQQKEDEGSQSDILDLDSHKVVHNDWTNGKAEKRPNEDRTMVWESPQSANMFHGGRMFVPTPTASNEHSDGYANNGVSSSSPDIGHLRAFEANTTTQIPPASSTAPSTKSANWKSNEARRPKTYNCTACNKWFTSSGHLKRHYNTTLHKNAVKSSGQPDPATMPISAHHHPAREATSSKDGRQSNSPREDSRVEDSYPGRLNSAVLQQQHSTELYSAGSQPHSSLMAPNSASFASLDGSPPNGDAGLSAPETRGLISMGPSFGMMSPAQPHMIPMDAAQFQMYPNELAPHVTQAMDTTTSSISTTGEPVQYVVNVENQPLPSFAQIQAHLGGGYANVGGLMGPVMASISYYPAQQQLQQHPNPFDPAVSMHNQYEPMPEQQPMEFSPMPVENNNDAIMTFNAGEPGITTLSTPEPVTLSTEEESKENESGNTATGSPSISSSTADNQEDLSKTKCFDCDKVFNRPCYLTQHNKTCHNGDKPFKCSRCGKRFATEDVFHRHEGKHAGNKPHKCEMCPKMFNHKTDLRRHICCHTGQKPYSCAICDKGFIRKDHMMKHMDTHLRKREKLSAMRS